MLTVQIDGLQSLLTSLGRMDNDLPRAIASGMNRTMRAVEQHELNAIEQHLDRPTPFTINATGIIPATINRLETVLFVKDIQAEYLRPAIYGGRVVPRQAKPENTIVPVMNNVRLNVYGNLQAKRSRGALDRLSKGGKRFVGKVRGRVGVFERLPNRRLKTIVFLDPSATREKRLPWFETAERVIRDRGERDMQSAIDRLLSGRGLGR